MSQDFYLHFTPDYSTKSINSDQLKYPYFNKPFGMLHWMEHALGYYKHDDFANTTSSIPIKQPSNNPNDDTIIFLLDPDQILLRPLTHDFSKNIPPDDDDMKWVARRKKLNNTAKIVQHRTTIAQQYGYGGQWLSKVNLEKVLPPRSDKSEDQKPPSPLWKLNVMTAKKFAAGPPYIATARDMYAIVHTWADFVPRVHDDCPTLLAEMFAYNLAAHHIHRQPYTSPGFMVSSDVEDVTEAWYRIDDYFNKNTFTTTTSSSSNNNNNNNNFCARQYPPLIDDHHHPFVLHYCQQYKWEGSMFLKYVMPGKFFTCTSDLLQEPNYDSWIVNASTVRSAYMICTLIPALNEAATFYKQHHCRTINTTNGNATSTAGGGRSTSKKVSFDKKLVLVESAGFKKQRERKNAATAPAATQK